MAMESDDEILGLSPRGRYNTFDYQMQHRKDANLSYRHTLTLSDLPQRSRSMMNLSSLNQSKRHSWLLPESPTVNEKQTQLTKRKGISGVLSPPPPKTPSVERYLDIFIRLKAAYSGFVIACNDIDPSSLSMKDKVNYEKCTKKLALKLQKIQDLHELYIHQEHMREGAEKLLKTMEKEVSKKIKSRIDYVKINLKKNLTRLCAVEDEVNNMAGTMKIQIIGLIGFARLSSGDVYSVQLKHGYDKLTSKCRVVGQGQKWTNPNINIKINAANDLILKVHEVRKINGNPIGVVKCPIANFLSSEGQEFLLPVNSTGSLKLKIATFWSPFSSKEETLMEGKFSVTDVPVSYVDSLSDSSLTSSPCSTPKSGTLSSMPSLLSKNGTLTPMKISVNGAFVSPQASVIKHSRADHAKLDFTDATILSSGDSTWFASVRTKSLPDIAKTAENETAKQIENDSSCSMGINNNSPKLTMKHASSCDQLSDRVILRDTMSRDRNKPRPLTLGPTFTNGFSSQSDYENVVDLITSAIIGEKPDVVPEKEPSKAKKKQRPKSIATPYKPVPIPDYPSPRTSPAPTINRPMPVISEPDYSPPPCLPNKNGEHIFTTEVVSSESTKVVDSVVEEPIITENIAESKSVGNAATSSHSEVENIVIVNQTVGIANSETDIAVDNFEREDLLDEENINDDDTFLELRAILLDLSLKFNSLRSEWSNRLIELKNLVNELVDLVQVKKKPISRTASIENALNSIDSAFDFLSEHQTLKPEKKKITESEKRIFPGNWRKLKKTLCHHLQACQVLCQNLEDMSSPLKIMEQKCLENLLKQWEILENIVAILTTNDSVTPYSASLCMDKTGQAGKLWETHCSKTEFHCTSLDMKTSLSYIFQESKSTTACDIILERIQDGGNYRADSDAITVFQFACFLSRYPDLTSYFEVVRKEEKFLMCFKQQDDLLVMSMMQDRKAIPIVRSCLRMIAHKLKSNNRTMQRVIIEFFTKLPMKAKDEAIKIYVELLEDSESLTRETACMALKYLEASKSRDMIAYLWKNDDENVRKAAYHALKVVGFPPGMQPSISDQKLQYSEVSTRL